MQQISRIQRLETTDIRHSISREAIIGHETTWKISNLGAVQSRHGYDESLLEYIRQEALRLKEQRAMHKHLNLTFITGADRYIPEIRDLINDPLRLERLSDMAGTKLEPYPFSVVGSTVTFMGPHDGAVDWHCDGVPVTELIPLSISDPIVGGELEIFLGNCEVGKAKTDRGELLSPDKVLKLPHKMGYSTLGQFVGILHRTVPIQIGERVTLVLNMRSVEKPYIDDNRMFYLAADNDHENHWITEMAEDVWKRQLPAYRAFEAKRESLAMEPPVMTGLPMAPVGIDPTVRSNW